MIRERQHVGPAWFWPALVGLAAILRLVGSTHAPLSLPEADAAWQAYRVAVGLGPALPASPPDNGLWFGLQTWLLAILGAGDGVVRSVAALTGIGLVLTPLALRSALGPWGTMTAALLLAVDPWLVEASRRADGSILAPLLGVLLLGAIWNARARAVAVLGGLFAVSGPLAWSLAPVLGVAALLRRHRLGLTRERCLRGLGAAALIGGLASTALLLHPPGAASLSASLTAWLDGWQLPKPVDFAALATNPVALVLGLAAALWFLAAPSGIERLLVPWGAWAFGVTLFRGGDDRVWLAVVAALLAGRFAQSISHVMLARRVRRRMILGLAAAAILAVPPWPDVLAPETDDDLPRLVRDVETLSAHRPEVPLQIEVAHRIDPLLAWYLRDHPNVRWMRAPEIGPRAPAPIVITPRRRDLTGERYVGSRYRLGLASAPAAPEDDERVLWVRLQ